MRSPNDILNISKSRLEEAQILCNAGYYEGAFYLAGYSIELALKAKICMLLDIPDLFYDTSTLNDLNSFKTHKLSRLILLAGLRNKFDRQLSNDLPLSQNWNVISNNWSEECRYLCCGTKTKIETIELINAISDTNTGVITWILNN